MSDLRWEELTRIEEQMEGATPDEYDDLAGRWTSAYDRASEPATKADVDVKRRAERQLQDVQGKLAAIEAKAALGTRTAQDAQEAAGLRQRAAMLSTRIPYVGLTDDDLTTEVERYRVQEETAAEAVETYGKDSARGRVAARAKERAWTARQQILDERKARAVHASLLAQKTAHIERQATIRARERWHRETAAALRKVEAEVRNGYRYEAWEIERAKAMVSAPPPKEIIEQERAKLEATISERHAFFGADWTVG